VYITVEDNGLGIAPERLPEIFQLFAQGERSIARSEGGLGVGLTIVQRLAELHGGSIDAHSDGPHLGSVFTVRLPAAAGGMQLPSAPSAQPGDEDISPARRLLIVDDNADSANAMAKILRLGGHDVAVAFDGDEALASARSRCPEAVVLDIGLPGMDGYEVARRLREECSCEKALIIAVTGYGQDQDRAMALEKGFDHHLVKPVDLGELKRILAGKNAAIGRSRD
jgi:CheY-like chemotaxis protein